MPAKLAFISVFIIFVRIWEIIGRMKQFIKNVLAVICGLIIFNLILFMLGMAFIGAIAAVGKSASTLPKEGVLYMDMSQFSIADQESMPDPLSIIQGGSTTTIGIWKAVQSR